MRLIKIMMACSIFILALTFASCKKDVYSSRDISGLVPEPVVPEPVDPTLVVFDNCEDVTGWDAAGGAVLDPSSKKQGENSIKATIGGGDALRMQKALTQPIDTKLTKETAQLTFWLFVEDASKVKLTDGQIEVTSSGTADQQEYNWPTSVLAPLQTGWNLIKLSLANAGESGGGADLSKINFFRMYLNTTAAASPTATFTMALDAIGFVASGGPNAGGPTETGMLDACDVLTGWEAPGSMAAYIEPAGKKEGTGFIKGKVAVGEEFLQFAKKFDTPFDTKVRKDNGIMSFWFYVDRPADFKEIQVQISSTDNIDATRFGWNLMDEGATGVKLKSGWNQINLDLNRAYDSDGGPFLAGSNTASVKYFRIFGFTNTKVTTEMAVGIDGIKFLKKPAPEPSLLDGCDKLDGWDLPGDMAASIETAGKKEGTGYIKGKIPSNGDYMRFAKIFATSFDSKVTKENGQLTFWIFLDRVAEFNEIQVQISSTDNIDATRYGWSLLESANLGIPALRDGWNEVKLDLSKVSYDADGGANLAAIKYFRIFGITKAKVTSDLNIGLDGIKFLVK